jgi:hypothetical protein
MHRTSFVILSPAMCLELLNSHGMRFHFKKKEGQEHGHLVREFYFNLQNYNSFLLFYCIYQSLLHLGRIQLDCSNVYEVLVGYLRTGYLKKAQKTSQRRPTTTGRPTCRTTWRGGTADQPVRRATLPSNLVRRGCRSTCLPSNQVMRGYQSTCLPSNPARRGY